MKWWFKEEEGMQYKDDAQYYTFSEVLLLEIKDSENFSNVFVATLFKEKENLIVTPTV